MIRNTILVGDVSLSLGRSYIGIELNPAYAEMARNRIEHGTVDTEEIELANAQGTLFELENAELRISTQEAIP